MKENFDSPKERWAVRVLSGPHVGAQALVAAERFTIGSSLECDLVLTDPYLAPSHCVLMSSSAGITVEGLEGLIMVDGRIASEAQVLLKSGQVLTVGTTHLEIGRMGTQWLPATLPVIHQIPGMKSAQEEGLQLEELKAEPETEQILEEVPPNRRKVILWSVLLGAIAIGIPLWIGLSLRNSAPQMQRLARVERVVQQQKTEAEKVKEDDQARLLAKHLSEQLPGLCIVPVWEQEQLRLDIFLPDTVSVDHVRKILNEQGAKIPYNLINLKALEDAVTVLINAFHWPVKVIVQSDGRAFWTGYLPSPDAWNILVQRVQTDVPAIRENLNHIVYGTQLKPQVDKELEGSGFKDAIQSEIAPTGIKLTGSVSSNQEAAWHKAFEKLQTVLGDSVPLIDAVGYGMANNVAAKILDQKIESVSVSKTPWVALGDGRRLFIGAQIKDGYTLKSITAKGLEVVGPQGVVFIPVGGE